MLALSLFGVIFAAIFALYFLPKEILRIRLLEKQQYYELFFGAILIVFFFGYFQSLITDNPAHIDQAFSIASLFMIWYFATKFVTGAVNRDQSGSI